MRRVAGIRIRNILIDPSPMLAPEETAPLVAAMIGKEVRYEDLEELRSRLTALIVAKGYATSGVIIPEQEVTGGVVRLAVVEGRLSDLRVEGNRYFRSSYLASRIGKGIDPPLNVHGLQENLVLLQADPRILSISAELNATGTPGEAVLRTTVRERFPLTAAIAASNDDPPSTGGYRGDLRVTYANAIGIGDSYEALIGLSDGNTDYAVRTVFPLNRFDTLLSFSFRRGESRVVTLPFRDLGIESRSDTWGVSLSHPLVNRMETAVRLSVAGERRRSRTFLLGRGFSFSPGAVDGVSTVSVVRLSQEASHHTGRFALLLHSVESIGVGAVGGRSQGDDPDSTFLSWLSQLAYLQQVGRSQFALRVDAQLADQPLLALEKFAVGGLRSVRGYRRDLLVRDNGVSGGVEWRQSVRENRRGAPVLFLVPFYDFGCSWGNTASGRGDFIHSVGVGVKWIPFPGATLEVYYGHPLRHLEVTPRDLQDKGLHFAVSWELF